MILMDQHYAAPQLSTVRHCDKEGVWQISYVGADMDGKQLFKGSVIDKQMKGEPPEAEAPPLSFDGMLNALTTTHRKKWDKAWSAFEGAIKGRNRSQRNASDMGMENKCWWSVRSTRVKGMMPEMVYKDTGDPARMTEVVLSDGSKGFDPMRPYGDREVEKRARPGLQIVVNVYAQIGKGEQACIGVEDEMVNIVPVPQEFFDLDEGSDEFEDAMIWFAKAELGEARCSQLEETAVIRGKMAHDEKCASLTAEA